MRRCTRCCKGEPLANQAMCEDCWRDLGQMALFEDPGEYEPNVYDVDEPYVYEGWA